jgi:exosortase
MMIRLRASITTVGPFVLVFVLTWPAWRWLWGEWQSNPYYSHGLLVLPLSIYLGWRQLQSYRTSASFIGDARGLFLLVLGIVAFVILIDFRAYYAAAFAAILMIAALTWTFLGLPATKRLVYPFVLLIMALPLPFVERATLPLALWTGSCSTFLASWAGLDLVTNGNAVSLPNAELVIGAQCSGMSSLIAMTSMTSIVAYIVVGPMWGRIALLFMAAPLAVLGNILRVTNLLFVARYWGVESAFRFYHDLSGPLFFLIAFALLYPLSRLFQCRQLQFDRF